MKSQFKINPVQKTEEFRERSRDYERGKKKLPSGKCTEWETVLGTLVGLLEKSSPRVKNDENT